MKLDLVEIQKLSPPGLWDLGVLSAFIDILLHASGGIGYMRMAMRYRQQLRARAVENFNMRIKAWVLLCPARITWVRHIIGEAAIKKWRKNRLADYALSKYFGDWRVKFRDGFACANSEDMYKFPRTNMRKIRAYNWKLFALVKITNVERILFKQPIPKTNALVVAEDLRTAYFKLWDVDITDVRDMLKWQQPRTLRTLKPVAFTPHELELEKSGDVAEDAVEEEVKSTARIIFNPTEKLELRTAKKAIKRPP